MRSHSRAVTVRLTWDDLIFDGVAEAFGPPPWLRDQSRDLALGSYLIRVPDVPMDVLTRFEHAIFGTGEIVLRGESSEWACMLNVSTINVEATAGEPLALSFPAHQASPWQPVAVPA